MKRGLLFIVCIIPFLLTACTPSPEELAAQTATAQTAIAAAWTKTPTQTFTPTPSPTFTITPTFTYTHTPTSTETPTPTNTATYTLTPTSTSTPTITQTPTITPTPTYDFPDVVVNKQAHCRYGPSVAYLHAADLYPGDVGTVRGRFRYSRWLYIKFDKLNYFCWASNSVVDVTGDISLIYYTEPRLESIGSNMYGPPENVNATRKDNRVTITWNAKWMTEDDDRGYLIEAWVCQDGHYLWWTVSFPNQYTTSYSVQDDPGCPAPSSGEIRTVEKHGFSEAVQIPWPQP